MNVKIKKQVTDILFTSPSWQWMVIYLQGIASKVKSWGF